MPTSGGRAYEVLIVGADTDAVNIIAEGLRSLEMAALPQAEKTFDVSVIVSNGLTQATRYARNIVLVTTGIDSLRSPHISYAHNTYAQPQLVLHVRASSASQLRRYINNNVRAIEHLLVIQELNNGIATLQDKHNRQAEQLVRGLFGVRLWVPEDLTKWKRGKDFVWLSNNSVQGMQNICVYRYQGKQRPAEAMITVRDSVMRLNMPGEADGAYMTTVRSSIVTRMTSRGQTEMHGLWKMQGDFMGGPFVSLSMPQGDSTLVVEAFVYAPEMKKRSLVRRLEASLHTLKIED
jgi:hypothetical protein